MSDAIRHLTYENSYSAGKIMKQYALSLRAFSLIMIRMTSIIFGILSALLIGFSKTGLPGVSIPGILCMAEAFPNDAKQSVVAILPVLLVGDIFAVFWFNHHAQWAKLWRLFPYVIAGMVPGAVVFCLLDAKIFRPFLGVLVLGLIAFELWRRWREAELLQKVQRWADNGAEIHAGAVKIKEHEHFDPLILELCKNCELFGLAPCQECIRYHPDELPEPLAKSLELNRRQNGGVEDVPVLKQLKTEVCPEAAVDFMPHSWWFIALTGLLAGFSTFIANAAMPVMSVYLVSQGFNKREFIGTAAWFFFLLNMSKLPVMGAMHMLSRPTIEFGVWVAPVTLLGAFGGVYILTKIPQRLFNFLALALATVAAVRLIFW